MSGLQAQLWKGKHELQKRSCLMRSMLQHSARRSLCQVSAVSASSQKFYQWLVSRNDGGNLSAVHVGMSSHGRGLFASGKIGAGNRLLEISQWLMITPHDLPEELDALVAGKCKDWTKLVLFALMEQQKGEESIWAPYMDCLPGPGDLHNTFLWEDEKLEGLKGCLLHRMTMDRLAMVKAEYEAVQEASCLDGITFQDFKHMYATVFSRSLAIGEGPTLVMIPMLDFCNHNHATFSSLSYDALNEFAVITAGKDYEEGEEVYISYGNLSNFELALDYGFVVPDNPFDEAFFLEHFFKNSSTRNCEAGPLFGRGAERRILCALEDLHKLSWSKEQGKIAYQILASELCALQKINNGL